MADALFFIGAGASAPLGIPTMQDMVIQFESHLVSLVGTDANIGRELQLYAKVSDAITKGNGRKDLESVFTVIDAIAKNMKISELGPISAFLASDTEFAKENTMATDKEEQETAVGLEKLFRLFIKEKCTYDESMWTELQSVYPNLFNAIATWEKTWKSISIEGKVYYWDANLAIYTTNYDTAIEKYFEEICPVNDLFVPENQVAFLKPETANNPSEGVRVVHLHGAVNWIKRTDGRIAKGSQDKSTRIGRYQVVGEVMLYPIQQKDLYLLPWHTLFDALRFDLKARANWIVMGYSFNDEFIRNLFKQELEEDSKKRIILIDRDPIGIINSAFPEFKSRFTPIKSDTNSSKSEVEILAALGVIVRTNQ